MLSILLSIEGIWLSLLYLQTFVVYHMHTLMLELYGARVAQWVRSLDLATRTSLSLIRRGFAPDFVNDKNRCTRLAAASDKVYQLLAHGRWFSPGTPASSTTKTDRHDIAEILLKVALKHQISNQIKPKIIREIDNSVVVVWKLQEIIYNIVIYFYSKSQKSWKYFFKRIVFVIWNVNIFLAWQVWVNKTS